MREIINKEAGPPRILLVGPTNSGKTASLATLNKISTNGIVLVSEDKKISSYYRMCKWLKVENPATCYAVTRYDETVDALADSYAAVPDWLAFDGLSGSSDQFYNELFPRNAKIGKSDRFQLYEMLGNRVIHVAMLIRDGPWKFAVVTALPARDGGSDKGEMTILLDGQMANKKVPPMAFNGIAQAARPTQGKDGLLEYRLSFMSDGMRDAGDQFSVSDAILGEEYPDWYDIFKKAGKL